VSAFIGQQKAAGFAVELTCRTLGVSASASAPSLAVPLAQLHSSERSLPLMFSGMNLPGRPSTHTARVRNLTQPGVAPAHEKQGAWRGRDPPDAEYFRPTITATTATCPSSSEDVVGCVARV
jgi:hypothetical protein